jgi:hypothetical protein
MSLVLEAAHPVRVLLDIALRKNSAVISRAVIDQQQLPSVIGLSEDADDCFLDVPLGIQKDDDD